MGYKFRGASVAGACGNGGSEERIGIVSVSPSATHSVSDTSPWTVRGLIVSHKTASLVIAGLCVLTVGFSVLVAVGPMAGAVTDSTTCTQWGSTNVNGQDAYARLYVREHGPVSRRWGPAPTGVVNAINAGCFKAYGEDVSDQTNLVQAISGNF